MKTDLTTLGDASWWVTTIQVNTTMEPKMGYLHTVNVDGYGRQCVIFFAVGRVHPKLGARVRVQVRNGKLIFPVNRKESQR